MQHITPCSKSDCFVKPLGVPGPIEACCAVTLDGRSIEPPRAMRGLLRHERPERHRERGPSGLSPLDRVYSDLALPAGKLVTADPSRQIGGMCAP
jgi:hypothetical protein